ncbi:MAG TPA: ABC transporter ATP-binding protein [Lachnospiraceae bacterium]|nr:ABC transporter ATP-binding protein [Lachnospiraceae bacterium]
MSITSAIELKNITKKFGNVIANSNVSLTVNCGEILALLGENGSGKTTLMNMLSGIYFPDSGTISVDGREVTIRSPKDAFNLGIGMVHQHFKLVDVFTAAENIVLGLTGKSKLNRKTIADEVTKISQKYGFVLDPNRKIYDMSVSEKQTAEIIKVLYRGANILILDEPTAVLTPQETNKLFEVLRNMKKDGKAIIIITHKLNEVMDISDKVAVLRKGEYIDTVNTNETNPQQLTDMMVGHAVSLNIDRPKSEKLSKRLEIKNVSCISDEGLSVLDKVSFTAFGGEILGVAGIAGSGQRELCEAIAGLQHLKEGSILYHSGEDGHENVDDLVGKNPMDIRQMGISLAFVPEDRLGMGLVADMGMVDNMMLRSYRRGKSAFVDRRLPKKLAEEVRGKLKVVTPGINTPVRQLSGGNVQKVLLGREIASAPTVIMAAYPVRGLDINSSYTIYNLLNQQKSKGVAVIYIGEDLDVLLELCDRILVLCGGKVSGIVDGRTATKEQIGLMMTQIAEEGETVNE